MTKYYIGSALVFPISGREEIGATITIDIDDLQTAIDHLRDNGKNDPDKLQLIILPLKSENVDSSRTHSVKLTKLIIE